MADIWNERYMTLFREALSGGEYPSNNERQGVSSGRSSEEASVMDVERRTKQIHGY